MGTKHLSVKTVRKLIITLIKVMIHLYFLTLSRCASASLYVHVCERHLTRQSTCTALKVKQCIYVLLLPLSLYFHRHLHHYHHTCGLGPNTVEKLIFKQFK